MKSLVFKFSFFILSFFAFFLPATFTFGSSVEAATKNPCKDTSGGSSPSINVEHKKQCEPKGPPSKGGKDGKKCVVPKVEGGTVEGICKSGCCVYEKASEPGKDSENSNEQQPPSSGGGGGGGGGSGMGDFPSIPEQNDGLGSDSYDYGDYSDDSTYDESSDVYGNDDSYEYEEEKSVSSDEPSSSYVLSGKKEAGAQKSDKNDSGEGKLNAELAEGRRFSFFKSLKDIFKAFTSFSLDDSKKEGLRAPSGTLSDMTQNGAKVSPGDTYFDFGDFDETPITGFDRAYKLHNPQEGFFAKILRFFLAPMGF